MPRKIRPSKRVTIPKLVVCVAVATASEAADAGHTSTTRKFESVSYIAHRRVHGRWVLHSQGDFDEQLAFWGEFRVLADTGQTVYTVCPDAGAMLGVLGFWDRLQAGEFAIDPGRQPPADGRGSGRTARRGGGDPLILSGSPDVIGFRTGRSDTDAQSVDGERTRLRTKGGTNHRYRWVGVRQFGEPTFDLTQPPHATCRLISEWFRTLLSRWVDQGFGAWRDTCGSAAWSTYTLRSARVPIVTHERGDVCKMENAACHGGRSSIFTDMPIGMSDDWNQFLSRPEYPLSPTHLPGPIHRLDVRAMYPTIMRDGWFPTRLVGVSRGWSVSRLRAVSGCMCLLARVRVRSARCSIPRKTGNSASYPSGEWITTLATPEIVAACDRGEIKEVYEVARYESGRPFEDWAKWILAKRTNAKRFGPPDYASWVKQLAVSLSGRLARKSAGWEHRPGKRAKVTWGEWIEATDDGTPSRRFRSLGGVVQEYISTEFRTGTLAACYSHITSYGRVQMDRYREIAGFRNVIAQHTDGLMVTDDGLANLQERSEMRRGEWGRLQYEGAYTAAWYRTPNHYWADGNWTYAGLNAGFGVDDDGTMTAVQCIDPVRSCRDPSVYPLIEKILRVRLDEVSPGETIGEDGWVIPPTAGRNHSPFRSDGEVLQSPPRESGSAGRGN